MIGIALISFSGTLNVNPIGDGLALIATICWASYSLVIKKSAILGTVQLLQHSESFLWVAIHDSCLIH